MINNKLTYLLIIAIIISCSALDFNRKEQLKQKYNFIRDEPYPIPSPSYSNFTPVIGIFGQPSEDLNQTWPGNEYTYFPASYAQWVEQAGGRPVPLPFNLPDDELLFLMQRINGILMPGGDASLWVNETTMTGFSNMTKQGAKILKKAQEFNRKGDYFPIWATCMSYEMLLMIQTQDDHILQYFNSPNHSLNTTITNITNATNRVYDYIPQNLRYDIEHNQALFYNHRYGISVDRFQNNQVLSNFYDLTSWSIDNDGKHFVGSLQGKQFPFYLSQFHPEKMQFEWLPSTNANHAQYAIQVGQYIGDFFINEARKSKHRFDSFEEMDSFLIYNYCPYKTYEYGFVQCYVFKNQNNTNNDNKNISMEKMEELTTII